MQLLINSVHRVFYNVDKNDSHFNYFELKDALKLESVHYVSVWTGNDSALKVYIKFNEVHLLI